VDVADFVPFMPVVEAMNGELVALVEPAPKRP
jgi:hypothetical protein